MEMSSPPHPAPKRGCHQQRHVCVRLFSYDECRGPSTEASYSPRAANAGGSEPATSPKPPVLAHGATSELTNTIFMGSSVGTTSACATGTQRSRG
jgi:hypothetical protein